MREAEVSSTSERKPSRMVVDLVRGEPSRMRGDGLCARETADAQLEEWLGQALQVTARCAAGDASALPAFFIRLFGVLTEIADFADVRAFAADGDALFPNAQAIDRATELAACVMCLRVVFDADELLYIAYRRHTECHPFQRAYRSHTGEPSSARYVPAALLAGRRITTDEAERAIQRLLWKYGLKHEQLGFDLARRTLAPLKALEAAARRGCTDIG